MAATYSAESNTLLLRLQNTDCVLQHPEKPTQCVSMSTVLRLPPPIEDLVKARDRLRQHYDQPSLTFTLDGNLVGDLGEALAVKYFGLTLTARNDTGIDGYTADNKSVQVKATGKKRGPAFRMLDTRADYLLFFSFNFEEFTAEIIYNGPEDVIRKLLPEKWDHQRAIPIAKIKAANAQILPHQRLPPIIPT